MGALRPLFFLFIPSCACNRDLRAGFLAATLYCEDRPILKGVEGAWLLRILFIYFCHVACGVLVPKLGIEPVYPAVKAQSPNHWTTRKVLRTFRQQRYHASSSFTWERKTPFLSLLFFCCFQLLSNIACRYKTYHLYLQCLIWGCNVVVWTNKWFWRQNIWGCVLIPWAL